MVSKTSALRTVSEIGRHARECRSVDEFGQVVVDTLARRVGFEYGAILIKGRSGALAPLSLARPDDDPESLVADKEFVRSRLVQARRGVTAWVAEHGTSVRVADVGDDRRYYSMRDDIRSELCVPIRVAGRTLGVLNTESTRRSLYTRRDQDLLEIVALEVAAVLGSAGADTASVREWKRLVSICADCKSYRAADGRWHPIEELFRDDADLQVSHGLCPNCLPKWR